MTKILTCRFKQCFRPFNMLAVHKCSDRGLFGHVSNSDICSLKFQNQITYEAHLFFQSSPSFMQILEMQKKSEEMFFYLEIFAIELFAFDTRFYWDTILFIGCQFVKKKSQDFRYYWNSIFWADFFSSWSRNMTKLLTCRFKQCFGPFNMLSLHKGSGKQLFRQLSNPAFCSL